MIGPTSRYAAVGTAVHQDGERTVRYLRQRFVPMPEPGQLTALHSLAEAERLDHVAARYFGDPTYFWMICDANLAMHPDELEVPGRRLAIALPQ